MGLVVEAEKAWRAAWEGGIPAGRADTDGISSGLSTARDLLQRISNQIKPPEGVKQTV